MSGLVPVNANAHSSVEIEDSCNDCCGCCGPRKVKSDPRRPIREDLSSVALKSIKVSSSSQPTLTQTAVDEWEITIDGRKISDEPLPEGSSK